MNPNYVDHAAWKLSYCKEYDSLRNNHTYKVITREHYLEHYSKKAIIPMMTVQVVKPDKKGDPKRLKSQIVALGNHKDNIWAPNKR